MNILTATSDIELHNEMLKTIQKSEYKFVQASNKDELISALSKQQIDIVIIDQEQQYMDNYDLCRLIRSIISHKYVYVIMLMKKVSKEDHITGFKEGVDSFITYPLQHDELEALINVGNRIVCYSQEGSQDSLKDGNNHDKEISTKPILQEELLLDWNTIPEKDRISAEIAFENGILDKNQLEMVFLIQKKEKKSGRNPNIVNILLKETMIEKDTANFLVAGTKQKLGKEFCDFTVKTGVASQMLVEKALEIQADEYENYQTCRQIDDILIDEGTLTKAQCDLIWENKNKEESDKSEKITGRIISFKPTAIQKIVIICGLLAVASIVISIVIIHSMKPEDKVYAFNFSTSILLKNNEKIQFNTSIHFKNQRKMLTAQAKLEKIYFALSQSLHEFTSDELIAKGEERRKESLKKVIKNTLTTEDIEIHIYGYKIVANHNKGEG